MKKLISLALTLIMLMSVIPTSVFANNSFGWSASSSGSTVIESVSSIKGNAVAFCAWGSDSAQMSAAKSQSGGYGISFSVMVSDLNSVRKINASGIDMLSIDKSGTVTGANGILATSIMPNKWYDVEFVVYPISKTYTVDFDGVSSTTTVSSIPALSSLVLRCTEIEGKGTIIFISDPSISETTEPGTAAEDAITVFQNNNSDASDPTSSSTRSYNSSYPDPTGAGRGNIFACTVQSTGTGKWEGGEFQSKPSTGPEDRTKMAVISADFYVPAIEANKTVPMVTRHELIGYCSGYYYFFQLNHTEKKLYYADNLQSVQLDYALGQWMTVKFYIDYPNDNCIVQFFGEDGSYIGGASWTLDFDSHSKVSTTIARFGFQFGFRDKFGPNVAYVDDYCWNYVTNNPVFTETIPYFGKTTVGINDDIIYKVKGANIDPGSFSQATVTVNGSVVGATLYAAGPQGVRVDLADSLLPETEYTVELDGIKAMTGTAIASPGVAQFKTKAVPTIGNLSVTESAGDVIASVPVTVTDKNLNIYAVAFNSDGSMAASPNTNSATGTVNTNLTATVSTSYSGAAEAYLWDNSMNIITPHISTDYSSFENATPCDLIITKAYEPVEKFVIKGTAKNGAAIKLYKVNNKGTISETKELIYIKEINAHANGYFETSFPSTTSGDIELQVNAQDGEGIKTIEQRIYSPTEAQNVIDQFNYIDNNPTYNGADAVQYNAMINHYDSLITNHYQLFGINLATYTTLSKEKMAKILLAGNGTYLTDSDVVNKYKMAEATAKFDAAATADDIELLFTEYSIPYNFASSQTYAYYGTLSETVKDKLYYNMSCNNDYENMTDVINVFEEQTILSAIECATVNSEVNSIIATNNSYIGLDLSVFNTLKNTSTVTSQVRHYYESLQLFKDDFIAKTLAAKEAERRQQNNNSVVGGGGAAPYIPSKEDVTLPVTEQVVVEKTTPGSTFTDIKLVPWAEESIRYLVGKGVVNGKSQETFAPNDNVKRSEFVKMIALAFPAESMNTANAPFTDVQRGAWYEQYVMDAYSRGIINGKSATEFGVDDNITREELVVMLYRVAMLRDINLAKTKSVVFYDDGEIANWAREAVYALAETEIVNGVSPNTFSGKNSATRAEAAKLVYCLMQREAE